MTDIVERLRNNPMRNLIFREAADEIEALREHVNALLLVAASHEPEALRQRDDNERLREELADVRADAALLRRALEPKP